MGRYLQLVAKETRDFHAIHRMIANDQGFQSSFVMPFNKDLKKWEEGVLEMAFTLKRDAATCPGPFGAPPTASPKLGVREGS